MRYLLCAALAALLLVPAASAKKPHRAGTVPTITVIGDPVFGGTVSFAYDEGTATPDVLFIYLECDQNGSFVLGEYADGYALAQPSGTSYGFVLGPTGYWTGGPADCTATLQGWSEQGVVVDIGSTSFAVSG